MKKEKISEILENINTKYVDEATLYTGKTQKLRFNAVKWGAAAACLSLVLVAAFAIPKLSMSRSDENVNGVGQLSANGTEETCIAGGDMENGTEANTGNTVTGSGGEIMPGGAYVGNDIAYEPTYDPTSENTAVASTTPDYPAMVMIDDQLYIDGGIAFMTTEEMVPDGKIVSKCDGVPTENGQSNFGSGYDYQFGKNGTLNVRFDDGWHVFTYFVSDEDTDGSPRVENATSYSPSANTPAYDPVENTIITGC